MTLAQGASGLSSTEVAERLTRIRSEQATLTGTAGAADVEHDATVRVLAASASPAELTAAADATTAPVLAGLLRAAARGAARG